MKGAASLRFEDYTIEMKPGDKATQDHWIFQQAATWPDIIRKNKTYDRPEWHYIDIPQCLDPSVQMVFDKRLPVNISTEYPVTHPAISTTSYRPSHIAGQHSRARLAPR